MGRVQRAAAVCGTAVAIVVLATAGGAFANGGPHGGYSATSNTDACAGCHRAHTARAENLLVTTVPELCLTCHGSSTTGADTNVVDGRGPGGADLLAGGFSYFKGEPVSSTHSVDGTPCPAWGAGTTWSSRYDCAGCHNPESGLVWEGAPTFGISPNALPTFPGRGQNVTMPLTCTDCHDAHGGRNYRMLQQRLHPPELQQDDPPGYALVTSNETGGERPDQPGYVADYVDPKYRLGLGDWCTGCHYTYQQTVSVAPFNAEDGAGRVTRHRHEMNMTIGPHTTSLPLEDPSGSGRDADDQLFCGTCHLAHGASTTMSGYAADVAPTGDSALLRLDNRGVCQDCHKK